ncbi:maltose alpha-D-glucosyltransferase [Falsiroseomonas bella]|uniref:maltose alpha-D-glucosyltransferase n=1 Tax=Falsiroseomonas bella TaxID=2184016 RepID=A0A317F7V6_9PROT|nr:maltose alpha-D-glucosyltransferase [Falsiroseomonas bella]PWS34835.1 maltose alpha-D-glucosyltransferase [Falsiroseomonas bella]
MQQEDRRRRRGGGSPREAFWWRDAVIYQLHLKSFMDSNDDGIGDFAGLMARLDHVAGLGVDAIWLLPFYPSPLKDDGYDISDYTSVNPDYGRLGDFRRFVDEAHARGLKVITELVINHTSSDHPWFQRARNAPPGSRERDWYVWSDDDKRYSGTRIIFCDTETSNWTWDPVAKAYYWHRFYSHQPDLNFDNPRVIAAVLRVMRFWLDMGVDGLRLDAVPYLIEREGTTNENLPETHAILRRIRAELDRRYPNRMLLAEANMWPEDVQQYFGDGDECHMCFHFPLMPRMYMAVAQEDRFPVTDILRQTPDIPEGCQWAVFLRNHDELTLEMVTDSERDALWSVYAADRRARINLGIRRRLAPLMERDRRRIELMNGLLLSMPGTPVIYYGDEIGMGDNVYLRDRDGVRTPMQWSPDRNGGFSRGDPAALVLPPIQDPLYGFQAVNVESQLRDPSSLLNWTRRMLAVRKRTRAFGRGGMRLLYPGNRKVLAYLRELDGEVVLCVFNLSRAAQAVELDLSDMAGRVPVEMLGGTPFPPVAGVPYVLTLPPYAFHWFLLAQGAALPAWHVPAPEPLPELRTLVARPGAAWLGAEAAALLEREILPEWLRRRRWFSAKESGAVTTRISYAVPLAGGDRMLLAEVETQGRSGGARWLMPLAQVPEEESAKPAGQLAMARLRQGARVGLVTDAAATDGFARAVLAACRERRSLATPEGQVQFRAMPALMEMDLPEAPEVRRLGGEQSNTSIILGEAVVLKLLRRLQPGLHPEAEMARHLTEAGYPGTPALLGEVVREAEGGATTTLALLHAFARNQGDAWAWTLDWLARTVDEAALTEAEPDEPLAGYLPLAEAIGRRLAQMHLVLAQPSADPDFAPEPADAAMLGNWVEVVVEEVSHALDLLARPGLVPPGEEEVLAARLLEHRGALISAIRAAAPAAAGLLATRVHGDFHLGQVLVAPSDAVILDFEGEPARPLAARRAKGSAWRDVAGLLRSLDYAAAVAAATEESGAATAAPTGRRTELIGHWRDAAGAAFLAAYRATWEAETGAPPAGEAALLDLFVMEKAAYEIAYEAANRPAWLPVPLRGLAALAERLLGEGGD